MKTIFLFIREPKLKMTIIRILLKNDFTYIEAPNIYELKLKLEFSNNAALLVQDYVEGEKEADLAQVLRIANDYQLPVLWIMPSGKMHLLSYNIRKQFTDMMLIPFNESILLRKIKGIFQISEKQGRPGKMVVTSKNILSTHSDLIMDAMERAADGDYSICIYYLQVSGGSMEINTQVLERLNIVLRNSDMIIEMGIGEFIVLCPFTPAPSLQIVKEKIQNVVESFIQDSYSGLRVDISGTVYPDYVKSYSELEAELKPGL
jgi:hypothetical protein